ncbi:hypothetical protein B0T16DRAFT_456985 [Cercophora newfieldiana]|uniref:Uncharacterized protein n=1 Tax=Cercophora newfieldiana TaxID=92897 RepID=A0AA40CUC1_9PEZI|nr:hypothetical protein B0T16DRAFT_456985 [Cercophora newfieldiana]
MSSISWQPSAGPARPHNTGSCRPIFDRRSSTSRGSTSASSTSSFSDDEDAITPCPPQSFPQQEQQHEEEQRQQPRPKSHRPNAERPRPQSWRSSQVMPAHDDDSPHAEIEAEVDSVTLWRRMLVIQRMFGCYNSARMRAALDLGVEDKFVPSRTCLDLLNDSIDQLPEESRRQLEQFLEHGESAGREARKSWRQRLHEMRVIH